MANTTFQIKRTSITGRAPKGEQLEIGELAINLADAKLFSKDTSNNVIEVGLGSKGDKGDTGTTGTTGTKGDKGEIGTSGTTGDKGDKGDTGATGATGTTGSKGDKGDTGAAGSAGDKGDKGDTGATGTAGDKGDKGDSGSTGAKGDKGNDGATGATGTKGDKGDTGVAGDKGSVGDKGNTGDTGSAGAKGDKGDTGSTGATGDKGDKGDTGANGATGDKGDKGDNGATGAAGAKGDTGSTGATGDKGDKGDTGATGDTGAKGDAGASGAKGDKGDTGATGATGAKGDTGTTGDKGDKGEVGSTGATGAKGDTGSKGDKGDTGPKGEQGSFGGATFDYYYSSNTTLSEPGDGYLKFNNTSIGSVTSLYIDQQDASTANVYSYLQTIDDSTSAIRGHFVITNVANNDQFAMFSITGAHTHYTHYFDVPVSFLSGNTTWSDNTSIFITFARTGDSGDKGDKGDTGSIGASGAKGDKGDTGATGTSGAKGDKGDTGATGTTGAKGDTGTTGDKGDKGDTGATGSTGTKGDTGSTGSTGAKGDKGDTGATGTTGAKGDTGTSGAKGDKGDKGDTGATGASGAKGDKGDTGTTGDKGNTGDKGEIGTRVYDVSTSGSSAYVIDSTNNPTLNLLRGFAYKFSISATGHPFWIKTAASTGTGDQYNTGVSNNGIETGSIIFNVPYNAPNTLYYICQYHSSMQGTINVTDLGPKGEKGDTGSTGATGTAGAKGDTGAKGDKGDTGTGQKGEKGDSGGGGGGFTNGQSIAVQNLVVNGAITANSSNGSSGQVLTSNGSGVYWSTVSSGNGSGSFISSVDTFTGNGSATTFSLSTTPSNENQTIVSIGGVYQHKSVYSLTGANIVFSEAPANNEPIEVVTYNGAVYQPVSYAIDTFTANGTANTFTLSETANSTTAFVTVDGLVQVYTDDYTISNTTLTLVDTPDANSSVQVFRLYGTKGEKGDVGSNTLISDVQVFTANGSTNTFNLSAVANNTSCIVVVDGLTQIYTEDYTISNTVLTFTFTPANNSSIQVINLTGIKGPKGDFGSIDGGGVDKLFILNDQVVTTTYTIPVDKNAGTFGPISVANDITVNISNGSLWTIV